MHMHHDFSIACMPTFLIGPTKSWLNVASSSLAHAWLCTAHLIKQRLLHCEPMRGSESKTDFAYEKFLSVGLLLQPQEVRSDALCKAISRFPKQLHDPVQNTTDSIQLRYQNNVSDCKHFNLHENN